MRLILVGRHSDQWYRGSSGQARCTDSWRGYAHRVPVEFLTGEQADSYGSFKEVPTRPELERFFLDDDDRDLIALRRADSHRLGIARCDFSGRNPAEARQARALTVIRACRERVQDGGGQG